MNEPERPCDAERHPGQDRWDYEEWLQSFGVERIKSELADELKFNCVGAMQGLFPLLDVTCSCDASNALDQLQPKDVAGNEEQISALAYLDGVRDVFCFERISEVLQECCDIPDEWLNWGGRCDDERPAGRFARRGPEAAAWAGVKS